MQFLPELRDFLNRTGTIYTVRGYMYHTTEIYVEGVGSCKRRFIRRVSNKEELSPYVAQSGFESIDAWLVTIRRFISAGDAMYLFKVVVRGESGALD